MFITGESGTGKELVAKTVHELSRRRKRPFIAVNCGAISPNLIESELFGHEKGSFTGADRQHQGFFERSHGGTLFLDEITEMPLELQVKLLRVLETGTFSRVGSTQTLEADVRVIAATNRPPETAVAAGKLREDLFYRLNVFPIALPPLRERADDIGLLAEHFLAEVCSTEGAVKRLSREAVAKLERYRWPGNVRELRNVVQRAFVMTAGDVISDEWLPTSTPAVPTVTSTEAAAPVTNRRNHHRAGGHVDCTGRTSADTGHLRALRAQQGTHRSGIGHQPEDAVQPPEGICQRRTRQQRAAGCRHRAAALKVWPSAQRADGHGDCRKKLTQAVNGRLGLAFLSTGVLT